MAALAIIAVILGFGFWVLYPLFRKEDFRAGEHVAAGELKDLYALKDVAYDTLRDIEFDFRMGKMAEKDYRELKARYQGEAAEILAQIDALEGRLDSGRKHSSPGRLGAKDPP